MFEVFIGTELLGRGALTKAKLRWNYCSIFPNVYVHRSKATAPSLWRNTVGAWLWTGRNGVIAGRAAAALHGALWVDADTPIEMIWRSGRPPSGIVVRNERIDDDEIVNINGIPVTSPARTALDLARHLPRDVAVRHLDALAHATDVKARDALSLAESRYPRARGLRRSEIALNLMDPGSHSPKETWLRLVLVDAGLPTPRTQIRVTDGVNEAFIDMGYHEPMVGLDYDGQHHSANRRQYVHDIGRAELIEREGWINIHVVAEHSRRFIVHRVSNAFARRGYSLRLRSGS
jgi:hypothetical protein